MRACNPFRAAAPRFSITTSGAGSADLNHLRRIGSTCIAPRTRWECGPLQIQEDTGGFTAFIPWSFQRENTSLGRFVKEEATGVEYLKTLAVSRLYLENILNIQSSWVTPGLKTCQVGLRFGGNDVGSIMIEENVVSAAGAHHQATEEELRRLIRDAGFIPKQRDTLYRTYYLS